MPEFLIIDKACRRCKVAPAKYEKTSLCIRRVCTECMDKQKSEWWQAKTKRNEHRRKLATLERPCRKCGVGPNEYRRHASNKDGYRRICVTCQGPYYKAYRKDPANKAKAADYMKEWCRVNNPILKLEVFNHYGGPVCACCAEAVLDLLTLDHIASDGVTHRRENNIQTGINAYRWAKKHNWPPIFQVMCFSCNCGRAFSPDNICPHETARLRLVAA